MSKTQLMCLALVILCHITSGGERRKQQNWQEIAKQQKRQEREQQRRQRQEDARRHAQEEKAREFEEQSKQRDQYEENERKRQECLEECLRQQRQPAANKKQASQQERRTRHKKEAKLVLPSMLDFSAEGQQTSAFKVYDETVKQALELGKSLPEALLEANEAHGKSLAELEANEDHPGLAAVREAIRQKKTIAEVREAATKAVEGPVVEVTWDAKKLEWVETTRQSCCA